MDVGRLTGAFDLVTVAELDVIAQVRSRCARLVARVHTDEQVRRLEGIGPVMPLDERVSLVAALRDVDDVDVAGDDDLPGRPERGLAYVFTDAGSRAPGQVLRPRLRGSLLPAVPAVLVKTDAKGSGTRLGHVPGGWDMFHVGHLRILERARAQCDRLVVGVVADASSNKLLAWERVGFDVLFKGDDWQGTAKGDRLEAEMAQVGVELRYFLHTPHTSSTALRTVLDAR